MTAVAERPTRHRPARAPTHEVPEPAVDPEVAVDQSDGPPPLRVGVLACSWLAITVLGVLLVLVSVGPITEQRDQQALLRDYRTEIESATNEAFGLAGIEVPTEAPSRGAPVAILDIEALQLRRVVVEGTDPDQTRQGPGHVVGTGAPGQPGNSVVVGRRGLHGGAFGDLGGLAPGDRILVTTVQGQSVYEVEHVDTHRIEPGTTDDDADTTSATTVADTTGAPSEATADAEIDGDAEAAAEEGEGDVMLPDGPLTTDQLYGASDDDRLTLVTSASAAPWSDDEALVVVARMDGEPFTPTPQGGRTAEDDGRRGAPGYLAPLLLALLAYVAVVVGAVWLHRNVPWRSAYLLTAPLLIALTIVLAEQLASALPAWS